MVGNLPYNISTPLLFHLLEQRRAHRRHALHAAAGSGRPHRRRAGRRGLRPADRDARALGAARRCCSTSGPARFSRRPRSGPPWCGSRCAASPRSPVSPHFGAVVAAAFSQRRKTLRNALRDVVTREQIEAAASIRACARRRSRRSSSTRSRRRSSRRVTVGLTADGNRSFTRSASTSRPATSPSSPSPKERRYVFSYTITIRNEGSVPAKLLTRHWIITDANGKVQEVRGEGVVGEQPHLQPGPGLPLFERRRARDAGRRHAGQLPDGGRRRRSEFDAPIAPFRLAMPGMLAVTRTRTWRATPSATSRAATTSCARCSSASASPRIATSSGSSATS